jgi:dihydrofolate reductase
MARIINTTFVSVDGVINHMEAWHFAYVDDQADEIATKQLLTGGALLMGRNTYDGFAASWPERDGEYAHKINGMRKYVASTTLKKADWTNTTVLTGDLAEEVSKLKDQPGGDILMYGFGPVAVTLLSHGLLDELHLWVNPAFAGVGTTSDMLFNAGTNARLKLLGTRTLDSGVVILSYEPTNDGANGASPR